MMIAARNAFLMSGAKLPYDAEVEYLRRTNGSGKACDLGINIDDNDWVIECDCRADAVYVAWAGAYQAYISEQVESTRVLIASANLAQAYAGYRHKSTGQKIVTLPHGWGTRAKYTLSHKLLVVEEFGGVVQSYLLDPPSETVAGGTPLSVWMVDGDWYLYRMRVLHAGNIVRDLIPVRVGSGSSAVGYLYDRANPDGGPLGNGLYPNAGTGAFIIGPDK